MKQYCSIYHQLYVPPFDALHTIVVLASLAFTARSDLGSNTDSLADLELGDFRSDFYDLADDLVTRDDKVWRLPWSPTARNGVVVLSDVSEEYQFAYRLN